MTEFQDGGHGAVCASDSISSLRVGVTQGMFVHECGLNLASSCIMLYFSPARTRET